MHIGEYIETGDNVTVYYKEFHGPGSGFSQKAVVGTVLEITPRKIAVRGTNRKIRLIAPRNISEIYI